MFAPTDRLAEPTDGCHRHMTGTDSKSREEHADIDTCYPRPITNVDSNDVICNGGQVAKQIIRRAYIDMHLALILSDSLYQRIL